MPGFEPGTYVYEGSLDERTDEDHCDTTSGENERSGATRILAHRREGDGAAFVDRTVLELLHAQARGIEHRDRAELRKTIIALLVALEH
jgi:hypothetical protein